MSDEKKSMEIFFPFGGLNESLSFEKQPPITSSDLRNVRPHDVEEERGRGGQRPGLLKAFSTRVTGDYPIVAMVQVNTIYLGTA